MSDDPMLKALEAEERKLMAELEQTPAFRRLKLAQTMIAEYRNNPAARPADTTQPATAQVPQMTRGEALSRAMEPMIQAHRTKTAQVEAAAVEYLTQKGRRATSGEILPAVVSKGIAVTGKTPSKTISSYLSTSKRFDNHPALGGYGLVEWNGRRTAPTTSTQTETEPGPDKSAGSTTNGFFS